VPILPLPTTNTASKAETDRAAGKTGCRYNGPTRIVLNANGTMTVTSLFTTASAYSACVGTNVALPSNGVIYVQNVPSGQSASCSGSQNRLGYPISNDVTDYGCRDGDAFVSGTLKGRLTIAAENNIVIVDNTTYATTGRPPPTCWGWSPTSSCRSTTRSARAGTTSPTAGPGCSPTPRSTRPCSPSATPSSSRTTTRGTTWGTITINGVIAQKWRGPVGTSGGTGYLTRLRSTSPPYVQGITGTDYRTSQWAEVTNSSGLPA